jgi:signal transduction histidine kinase
LLIWFVIGRRALKRIDGVSNESKRIIGGDLTRRLPVGGSGDEFDRLAGSLNGLLDRIETLDKGVRDVSNNVAHDLKTPLTRLRARTESSLLGSKSAKDLKEALKSNLQECEALIRTFDAILTISKLEAGTVLDNRQTTPLRHILANVVDLMEPSAEDAGVAIELDAKEEVETAVNRELLAQALLNLIENALNHGGEQLRLIVVQLKHGLNKSVEIIVSDNGCGIPDASLDKATERFVRLDPSRSTKGTGLGLSLVKAVAQAHGGSFALRNNAPGLTATITIPQTQGR